MAEQTPIRIDIWSDIACPWCYIGKRRLEKALASYEATEGARPVEIQYHSYELSPDVPVDFEGSQVDFLVQRKGMPAAQVQGMLAHITELAAGEGLNYDMDAVKTTKTLLAHELIHFAASKGKQVDAIEALFDAYFVSGEHVGKPESLADIAERIGLDREEALAALNSNEFTPNVKQDLAAASVIGVQGVPFYVFQNKYAVSGAQSPDVFEQALTTVASELATEEVSTS